MEVPAWAIANPPTESESDRLLASFGYDAWDIRQFLKLPPHERLRRADGWAQLAMRARSRLG